MMKNEAGVRIEEMLCQLADATRIDGEIWRAAYTLEPEKFNQEFLRVIEKEVTPTQLQRELGLTASTFYRYRKDFFEKFPQFVQFQK